MITIIRNAAFCKRCNQQVESTVVDERVKCKCGNVLLEGGRKYIRKNVKDASQYTPLAIYNHIPPVIPEKEKASK